MIYFDWDPDYEEYLEKLAEINPFGPYDEYTGKPLKESNTRVGTRHHKDCSDPDRDWECCRDLWLADYEVKKEAELEEMHQEWWT